MTTDLRDAAERLTDALRRYETVPHSRPVDEYVTGAVTRLTKLVEDLTGPGRHGDT